MTIICKSFLGIRSLSHFRHGWRVDKTMTSFHKNNIFVKTRKVMGNTDVAHYRGRQSIYNICILNDCKLTFEFFKNYIFEKRRQFLNRILATTATYVQKVLCNKFWRRRSPKLKVESVSKSKAHFETLSCKLAVKMSGDILDAHFKRPLHFRLLCACCGRSLACRIRLLA